MSTFLLRLFENLSTTNTSFFNSKMTPIQESGYEGDYGYEEGNWGTWDHQGRSAWDQQQQHPQHIYGHDTMGYGAATTNGGLYPQQQQPHYEDTRPRVSYSGRTVGGIPPVAAAGPAPDWPPVYNSTGPMVGVGTTVAGITTPPRHTRKLPQIPKPAEITQKLQQQKQLLLNNSVPTIG